MPAASYVKESYYASREDYLFASKFFSSVAPAPAPPKTMVCQGCGREFPTDPTDLMRMVRERCEVCDSAYNATR